MASPFVLPPKPEIWVPPPPPGSPLWKLPKTPPSRREIIVPRPGYWMVPTLVQAQHNASSAAVGSITVTITSSTAGNLLLVGVVMSNNTSVLTISTTGTSQTWHSIIDQTNFAAAQQEVWYAWNCASGTTAVTVTRGSGTGAWACIVEEWSGIQNSSDPLDKTASNNGGVGATPADSGTTAATTQANELWWAVLSDTNGATTAPTLSTPTNGFSRDTTAASTNANASTIDGLSKVVSATGTANTSETVGNTNNNSGYYGAIQTFKAAAAGAIIVTTAQVTQKRIAARATPRASRATAPATVKPTLTKVVQKAIAKRPPPQARYKAVPTTSSTPIRVIQKRIAQRPPPQARLASSPPTIGPTVARPIQKRIAPRPPPRAVRASSPATIGPTVLRVVQKLIARRPPPQARIDTAPPTIKPTIVSVIQKLIARRPPPRTKVVTPPSLAVVQARGIPRAAAPRPPPKARLASAPVTIAATTIRVIQKLIARRPPPQPHVASAPPTIVPTFVIVKQKATARRPAPQLLVVPKISLIAINARAIQKTPFPIRLRPKFLIAFAPATLPPIGVMVRQKPIVIRPSFRSRAFAVPLPAVTPGKIELLIDLGGNLYYDFISGKIALKVA